MREIGDLACYLHYEELLPILFKELWKCSRYYALELMLLKLHKADMPLRIIGS